MATASKTTKKTKPKLTDADHPSLCVVGGNTRLRVLEDFFVEQELPKWVRFRKEWSKIQDELDCRHIDSEEAIERAVSRMSGKSDKEKDEYRTRAKILLKMNKAVKDDDWNIRGKHEREVDSAILKQAKFVRSLSLWDKVRNLLHIGKRTVPVEIAMSELLDTIELTSTEQLSARLAALNALADKMATTGQYRRLEDIKAYRTIVACEAAVCAAGYTSYVTEDTMLAFLRKSERGTMVNFLRYYEDDIPQEVVDKKVSADALMVFDNYVVAYYSDLVHKAATVDKKVSAAKEKKEREKRRDPILFGLIKNSRKLYYICSWVTDTDDLTLEKLEKELGVTRSSLVPGASTSVTSESSERTSSSTHDDIREQNEIMRQIYNLDRAHSDMMYSLMDNERFTTSRGFVAYEP